jgi:hypothetical protein
MESIGRDWFSGEFEAVLRNLKPNQLKVTWRNIGRLGSHRIRDVQYFRDDDRFADILLVEGSRGIFSPLMKWGGQMPSAEFYNVEGRQIMVLVERDTRGAQVYRA